MKDGDSSLTRFAQNLHQTIIIESENNQLSEIEGSFKEENFTRIMIEYLIDAGEIEDGHVCYHRARGIKVNGYNIQYEEGRLDLFVSVYTQIPQPTTVRKDIVESAFKQLSNFLIKTRKGYHKSIEEASPGFDMAQIIYKYRSEISHVRLFLFTDGVTTLQTKNRQIKDGISYSFNIWDLRRTYRCVTSGIKREAIEINFKDQYHEVIPCLDLPQSMADYDAYIAIVPGKILCKIYSEYGSRLLERNVRSFLQAKGKVNKGIRQTILNEPHRFFAYNNGISATAEAVEFVNLPDGRKRLISIRDLQIVNGGQTTASLYQAVRKDKANLSQIYVQTKITVVCQEKIDEIVPLISRYANNQNKVNEADFYSNDPFHIRIEELSRTIWTPITDDGSRQTRWFYERARGQYADAKNREATPARRKAFTLTNPSNQKFTKTDLAKFEHTWAQLPHIVSLGAQKNFAQFIVKLSENNYTEPDEEYFQTLIAKAILFRTAEKIIQSEKLGGYRANVVTYTLALLSYRFYNDIDLNRIWKIQTLPAFLHQLIRTTSRKVHKLITTPPNGQNITEWCKRESCWIEIKKMAINISSEFICTG